ncbi:hypothetical protein CLU97_3649 [Chryseobacterium sp. 7]|nr:hypothetical protein CLU97_3649 [Chryseobacterium sp. 7]
MSTLNYHSDIGLREFTALPLVLNFKNYKM